jgi:hypothetical protein
MQLVEHVRHPTDSQQQFSAKLSQFRTQLIERLIHKNKMGSIVIAGFNQFLFVNVQGNAIAFASSAEQGFVIVDPQITFEPD